MVSEGKITGEHRIGPDLLLRYLSFVDQLVLGLSN